jgi:hypothetical protein
MDDIRAIARKTIAGINPNLTVVKFQTLDAQIANRFYLGADDLAADEVVWRTGIAVVEERRIELLA